MSGKMSLQSLESEISAYSSSDKLPILFIGHGHPMNALADNQFTRQLNRIGSGIDKPNAIMVISAHWETKGTFVSVNPSPKNIYDFGNFDPRLFQIKYEPKGHPILANEAITMGKNYDLKPDPYIGLDHGAWTVLTHLFPAAEIPVFQISLDYTKPPAYHYQLAQQLKALRRKGVLIIGSGNIVHNLGILDWKNIDATPFDWAVNFDELVKEKLIKRDDNSLINYHQFGKLSEIAIPSNDHYLPMIYTLGLSDTNEHVSFIYEGIQYGSISMRCFQIS